LKAVLRSFFVRLQGKFDVDMQDKFDSFNIVLRKRAKTIRFKLHLDHYFDQHNSTTLITLLGMLKCLVINLMLSTVIFLIIASS